MIFKKEIVIILAFLFLLPNFIFGAEHFNKSQFEKSRYKKGEILVKYKKQVSGTE